MLASWHALRGKFSSTWWAQRSERWAKTVERLNKKSELLQQVGKIPASVLRQPSISDNQSESPAPSVASSVSSSSSSSALTVAPTVAVGPACLPACLLAVRVAFSKIWQPMPKCRTLIVRTLRTSCGKSLGKKLWLWLWLKLPKRNNKVQRKCSWKRKNFAIWLKVSFEG